MANGGQENIVLWLDYSYEKTINLVCFLQAKWSNHIVIWAANRIEFYLLNIYIGYKIKLNTIRINYPSHGPKPEEWVDTVVLNQVSYMK